jgi:hypothetical protein
MESYSKSESNNSDYFSSTRERFEELIVTLAHEKNLKMDHAKLETFINKKGREILRQAMQDHLDLRSDTEQRYAAVVGSDLVVRTHVRSRETTLRTIFGPVTIRRLSYSARDCYAIQPMDAELNLPTKTYSFGLARLIAENAVKMSFEATGQTIELSTGISVPKRQIEEQLRLASVRFYEFYESRAAIKPKNSDDLLVLSTDGKGVVMRHEDLRSETRQRALEAKDKARSDKSKLSIDANRKRMSTVAAVYSTPRYVRTAQEVMGSKKKLPKNVTPIRKRPPRPTDKRVWASLRYSADSVMDDVFKEALKRDPEQKHDWVFLVDGDRGQLKRIHKFASLHGVKVSVVCDFIHVLEYIWDAAHCFYKTGSEEAQKWVEEKALEILRGKASVVAAGMRRKATLRKLSPKGRKAVDTCAGYLLNHSKYLKYNEYLSSGFPIATGVIEGACRHLIKDRLDITGARWSLNGAEAVLRMRAIWASGDIEQYWKFSMESDFQGNHLLDYEDNDLDVALKKAA